MTNTHALLDGTETAFRQFHASERLFACIFKTLKSLGFRLQLMRSPACTDPKRSIHRGQSSHRNYTGRFRSWPPATCRFSTRRSFDHHGKGNAKKNFEKKWNFFVSLTDLIVTKTLVASIDCEIACDCVKRANVAVGLRQAIFARTHAQLPTSRHLLSALKWPRWHTRTHTHLIIVCGVPRLSAWQGN